MGADHQLRARLQWRQTSGLLRLVHNEITGFINPRLEYCESEVFIFQTGSIGSGRNATR